MKKTILFLFILLVSEVAFCQITKMKLKKQEVVSPKILEVLKENENSSNSLSAFTATRNEAYGSFTIKPNVTSIFTKVYDSTNREVARIDSSGKLFVTDSLATIKMLLKTLGIKVNN